jgi:hypothetical protein
MKNRKLCWAGLVLYLILVFPLVLTFLESSMIGQMAVLIPGLFICGVLWGAAISAKVSRLLGGFNSNGIPGSLLAVFTLLFWILPRSIDASLNSIPVEIVKLVTIPLLAGVPMGISWGRLYSAAKGLIIGNLISMLFVMSWIYLEAPVRVCNNYLVSQQENLGRMLFTIGILLSLYYVKRGLFGSSVNKIMVDENTA